MEKKEFKAPNVEHLQFEENNVIETSGESQNNRYGWGNQEPGNNRYGWGQQPGPLPGRFN